MSHPALNPNLIDTSTPPIPEAYEWSEHYAGGLGPLMNLAQAAPSTPPPAEFLERLSRAGGEAASVRYGDIRGDELLRKAFSAEQSAIYGSDIAPDEVAITAGCNLAFVITMLSVAKAGEAVLLPAPWYFNHQMALQMLGIEARVLPVDPANGFVPEVRVAADLIDPRVRAIVLVTPNNPTGAVYPSATIAEFAALCRKRGIWLVLDETYRDFLPEGLSRPHDLLAKPDWRDVAINLYSFSKSYCIPGCRLGAITAGRGAMVEIEKALDTVQICPPRPAQSTVAWGIGALGAWKAGNRDEINRRAAACRAAFAELNDWQLSSIGAYFAYVRHPFRGVPSRKVAEVLAKTRGVLCLPGSYFGPEQDTHLRVAFANAGTDVLAKLPERLRDLRIG